MKTIALSTGHSEYDSGAIGIDGTTEFSLNKKLVKKILDIKLKNAEFKLIDEDCEYLKYPDHLIKTVQNVNKSNCDVCIEIHHNGSVNSDVKGGMVIYWDKSEKGKRLAECINQRLDFIPEFTIAEHLHNPMGFRMYWKFFQFRHYKSRTIKTLMHIKRRLYYLKETDIPACIIEPGYITNAEDLKFVKEFMLYIAGAVCGGVDLYFSM